ncbi:hypothetical protein [Sphingomonas adhaesiva]|uniref:hypothetical protein n=1 Tax=Sphingomonas adhaesiva TaxID=28212 RepID=UPI002FF7EB5A
MTMTMLMSGVERADAPRRLASVDPRRHAHVDEGDAERIARRHRALHLGDRVQTLKMVDDLEHWRIVIVRRMFGQDAEQLARHRG